MPKQSEALILRTYPFHEADLLVTLFTRAEGKIRGVAKSAKRSRRRFGGALEPLTHVVAHWQEKEKQELARLDSCDVISSPLTVEMTYPRVVALSYVAEVLDQLLPDREPSDDIFRLALSVVRHLEQGPVWKALTYFHPLADGLLCGRDKRLASTEITADSRTLAAQMLRAPLESFEGASWPRQRGAD